MFATSLYSPTRLLLLSAVCVCVAGSVLSPVRALQPVCSYASSARPAKFASGTSSFTSSVGSYAQYAETAFTTFINSMYNFNGRNLYLQYGSSSPSNYWNTALGIQALLQYASFHAAHGISGQGWGAPSVVSTCQDIVNTQKGESGENDNQLRDAYMDDMSWMIHGLTLLYQAPSANQAQYISMAQVLLSTIQQQDDASCCGSHPGGVWWDTAHSSKVTAAQIGVTVAALRLRETGALNSTYSASLLAYAKSHYSFWQGFMVNTQTGQVADHEDTQGTISWWGFTYNNGLMLGAAVHLYQATGTASYLSDAASYASYLLNGMQVTVSGGARTILNNDCGGCDGDCSQFHQVSFHYLTEYYNLLYQQAQQAGSAVSQSQTDALCAVYGFLQNNIDSLWINARNSSSGTFNCNWNAPFSSGTDGLQGAMNSAVSATSLFASTPLMMG